MNSLLILLLVVITTCNVYVLSAPAEDFDYEFSKVQTMAEVRAEIKETGKPGVVFVTQPWCGACKGLKGSVNADAEIKSLFENWVVVHAAGDELSAEWHADGEKDGYIPRVYFLTPDGDFAKVEAPNPQYAYFFPSAGAVKEGMRKVQDILGVGGGGGGGEL
ncbi:hypothetical protein TrVE_jg10589 [Triparma verrucosa]|nr:hypothetical protein TrVE_jg10589 [Triparma verrucosa]